MSKTKDEINGEKENMHHEPIVLFQMYPELNLKMGKSVTSKIMILLPQDYQTGKLLNPKTKQPFQEGDTIELWKRNSDNVWEHIAAGNNPNRVDAFIVKGIDGLYLAYEIVIKDSNNKRNALRNTAGTVNDRGGDAVAIITFVMDMIDTFGDVRSIIGEFSLDNKALSGVDAWIYPGIWNWGETGTNSFGRFSGITCEKGKNVSVGYISKGQLFLHPDKESIPTGAGKSHEIYRKFKTGTVSGRITSPDGVTPVDNGKISTNFGQSSEIHSNGTYKIEGIPLGASILLKNGTIIDNPLQLFVTSKKYIENQTYTREIEGPTYNTPDKIENFILRSPMEVAILTANNSKFYTDKNAYLKAKVNKSANFPMVRFCCYHGCFKKKASLNVDTNEYELSDKLPQGNHKVYAEVYDNYGNTGKSDIITINVVTPPSNLSIQMSIDWKNGKAPGVPCDICINSPDPDRIKYLRIIDKYEVASGNNIEVVIQKTEKVPYTFSHIFGFAGKHKLIAKGKDIDGKEISTIYLFELTSPSIIPSKVNISLRGDRTKFCFGETITIDAEIESPSYEVIKVWCYAKDPYENFTLIGEVTPENWIQSANIYNCSCSFSWRPESGVNGPYSLYAIAMNKICGQQKSKDLDIHIVAPYEPAIEVNCFTNGKWHLLRHDPDDDPTRINDLGIAEPYKAVKYKFYIRNFGEYPLQVKKVSLKNEKGMSFYTSDQLYPNPITPETFYGIFSITLSPSGPGEKIAKVTIKCNDPVLPEHSFRIKNTVAVKIPEITVLDLNMREIVSGDNTPSSYDGTDFGKQCQMAERMFFIKNEGTSVLNISKISIPDSQDFTISAQPANSL